MSARSVIWVLAIAVVCLATVWAEVRTSKGLLRGTKLKSRNGRDYWSFTRIPYAVPPLGNRRFMAPEPIGPWNGTLDATVTSSPCYQLTGEGPIGDEDCLYLNVYTPKTNASLPVMVYFHGGGWRVGEPGPSYTGRYFMDEDVVLVMPHYRLGAFGFFSTEDDLIPGNMGLKDMAQALEWTKNEIQSFGGDPNLITAFGVSAGAASAHYLCSLPRTKGLLKGCISESGVGGAFWSLGKPGEARESAAKVLQTLGCFGDNILECLQSKSAREIMETEPQLKFWTNEPLIIYGPVLENKKDGALLTEWPLDSDFPWLTGVNSQEGALKSYDLITHYSNKSYSDEFYSHKIQYIIQMFHLEEAKTDSATKIYDRFFQNNTFIDGMDKLYSESYFVEPVLEKLSQHKGRKFFYLFDFLGLPSYGELYSKQRHNITMAGTSHGQEYQYFFDTKFLPGHVDQRPKDVNLSRALIKAWVNFAKHQYPHPKWQEYGTKHQYLYIGNSEIGLREYKNVSDIIDFWKKIL